MASFLRNLIWKPSTVSWLSFLLMGVIVAGVGLSGTAHVVDYLRDRLMQHGIEHDQEITSALLPRLESAVGSESENALGVLSHTIQDYEALGFRIFVLDRDEQAIVIDSEMVSSKSLPIDSSWLADATRLDGAPVSLSKETGAIRSLNDDDHPMLVWLQEIETLDSNRLVLGIASDQKTLVDFLGDLHWHLDVVMLLTYILITLLGYYAVRSIGRIYEQRLESQVSERTEALQAAHEEVLLKTRLATIGQTASVLTHEMRNPLASIKFALSSVKGSAKLESRDHRRIDLVLGEVDRLDDLLSETLDYVRPVNLSDKPIDIGLLLDIVLKQQEPLIEEKEIRVKYEGCHDCIKMRVDQAQMHQVFLNLVKNAIEASPRQGEIGILQQHQGDVLVIQITNGGDPMSEEIRQKAFEPFVTTKPKGTGLGLGLVKRVVEEHGGSIEIVSNAEIGTRFRMIFSESNQSRSEQSN